ncbi:hypothetical protein B0H19DRAFT_1237026 [Mycena capillaripes]|nr:hypothetical protein B0H19DRAFT_1237026 [Mycena capillaripes]
MFKLFSLPTLFLASLAIGVVLSSGAGVQLRRDPGVYHHPADMHGVRTSDLRYSGDFELDRSEAEESGRCCIYPRSVVRALAGNPAGEAENKVPIQTPCGRREAQSRKLRAR